MGIPQPVITDYNAPSTVSNAQVEAYAGRLAAAISAKDKTAWEKDDPALWAAESAVDAHDIGYDLHVAKLPTCAIDNRASPIAPPVGYDARAKAVAQTQLEKAGVRLAMVLNKVF